MKYHRAKREDAKKATQKDLALSFGSIYDSIETIKAFCNYKANELIKSIELDNGEEIQVPFWTYDIPELICVATIAKSDTGLITYSLDYTQSTLF